ncbi:HvfC/BufC N-terminal domain-containing protein [Marinomonas gallaica]|uniref:HvfC/BufC N-terminal domain-containing protein n=1 Tax=Marinomonas gallaica TaxID=1806667 RepID=UPI00083253E8|nr:DNA-binding domain-containing protein [Marinomonas gallaica]
MQNQFNAALFKQSDELVNDIKGHSTEERIQRLNVYRNNVHVSLQTALGDIFPVCKQLVGEDFFNAMAHEYIEQNRPTSPILSEYGGNFSDFIANFPPAQALPYLSSLCELEYRLLQLTNTAEPKTLSLEAAQQTLSQVQHPEALALHLNAQCQLMHSPFSVGALYLAHQQPEPNLKGLQISAPEYLLLTKAGLYGCCYPLSEAEYHFINALKQNPNLSHALPDDDGFDLGQTLARLMTWQVFDDINES